MELIGRQLYLEEMERRYANKGVKTMALWGRRRIGKTAIIRKFCEGKPHIILTAVEDSYERSIESFDRSLDMYLGEGPTHSNGFQDILDRFKLLDKETDRMVIVIDEYSYLCESEPACKSYLQMFIDHDLQDMNAMLIICGSALAVMGDIFNDSKGPLYKRFIGPISVGPLSYLECKAFHPEMGEEDLLRIYAIAGGVPLYHILMSGSTVEDCIKNSLLGPFAPLREEADATIMRELSPVQTNLKIVRAISRGRVNIKEISEFVDKTPELCMNNLSKLQRIGIVSSLHPMCGASKKERIFRVTDGLVRLYNDVLMPNISAVTDPDKDFGYESILPALNSFYGQAFEDECRQYIRKKHRCKEIGSWWGKVSDVSTDIDIVALCDDGEGEYHVVCECKFRNKEAGVREFEELRNNAAYLKNCYNIRYCMFSRSGFTEELREMAESSGIELVTPGEMFAMRLCPKNRI
ncbi:MAG: ATP-binding protein [Candidatus Methanomethylophilaceae archaeon]|nr:ATP-binding protein [Candidatus Methanomethylophilaceae archaeon]MBP5734471.1 ATP-binding protein [Candidatus Methanomethylophilaceae archaeon]